MEFNIISKLLCEEEYRLLLDQSFTSFFIIKENNSFTYCSQSFVEDLGYTKNELINMNYLDLFYLEDKYLIKENIEKTMGGEEPTSIVIRGVHKDGNILYLEITKSIAINYNERNYTFVKLNNITDRYLLSKNLKNTKKNIESLVQGSPNALVLLDLNRKVKVWNSIAERIFGWKAVEIVGEVLPIVPMEKQDEFNNIFQRAINGYSISNCEVLRQRKDGTLVEVSLSTVPNFDSDGKISGFMSIYQDITERKRKEREMFDIQYALDQSSVVSITDQYGTITYVNDLFCKLYQYSREEIIGNNHRIINSGYHSKEYFNKLWLTVGLGDIWRGEIRNKAKDGAIYWMDTTIIPSLDENKKPYRYIAIRSDITEKKKLEESIIQNKEKLRMSEEKFQSLLQYSFDFITVTDGNGIITFQSPSFEKFGYKEEELIGKNVYDFVHPDDFNYAINKLNEILSNPFGKNKLNLRVKHAEGSWRYIEGLITNLLHEPSVKGIVINYHDITENVKAYNKIDQLAFHDQLTGLPNKKSFEKRIKAELDAACENNTQIALMHLDIDRFKYINDTLGNDIGDLLLFDVADRLKGIIENIGFIARNEGDEFYILLRTTDYEIVKNCATNIIKLFDIPFKIKNYELYLTTSIGISFYPLTGDTMTGLMKNAAIALDQAKQQGKNNFQFYTSTMNVTTFKTFTLQNDLRKAIKNDELVIYYQPIVDINKNSIVGAEALIRWQHPNWGVVSPNEFISIAEETGLIVPIGEWILEKACLQNKKWQDAGLPPITIAINISPYQFLQQDLYEKIKNIIDITGLEPKYLMIELTENTLIKEEASVLATVNKLKNLGVRIAIDDFGTGYSSLIYLKKFKFDTLKIDRSFISDITVDPDCKKITSTIINLGNSLNMKIVVEGVEKLDQLNILKELNCDYVQGYHFSRAIPKMEFEKILSENTLKPQEKINNDVAFENKRQFFRIELKHPLSAEMTIVKLGGKNVNLGSTKVLIEDLSSGGLRFLTNVKLPIRSDLVLGFYTKILNQDISLLGCIVWSKEVMDGISQYGLKFTLNSNEQSRLTKILNQLQINLRNKSYTLDTKFVFENKHEYLKKTQGSASL